MIDLKDKVILITGGATGLGADLAELCLTLGGRVALLDIAEDLVHATGQRLGEDALGLYCDISDEQSVRNAVAMAIGRYGRIDALVNNAAFTETTNDLDLLSTDLAVWDRTMAVNLRGTMLVSRAVVPHMIEQRDGAIVTMVSRAGVAPPRSGRRLAYSTSKAGLIMLARHIAVTYGKQGIRSNAVAPGTVQTERMLATLSEERLAQSRGNVLTPYLGEPADISRMTAYLISDAGRYITGQTIQVDGGVLSYLNE